MKNTKEVITLVFKKPYDLAKTLKLDNLPKGKQKSLTLHLDKKGKDLLKVEDVEVEVDIEKILKLMEHSLKLAVYTISDGDRKALFKLLKGKLGKSTYKKIKKFLKESKLTVPTEKAETDIFDNGWLSNEILRDLKKGLSQTLHTIRRLGDNPLEYVTLYYTEPTNNLLDLSLKGVPVTESILDKFIPEEGEEAKINPLGISSLHHYLLYIISGGSNPSAKKKPQWETLLVNHLLKITEYPDLRNFIILDMTPLYSVLALLYSVDYKIVHGRISLGIHSLNDLSNINALITPPLEQDGSYYSILLVESNKVIELFEWLLDEVDDIIKGILETNLILKSSSKEETILSLSLPEVVESIDPEGLYLGIKHKVGDTEEPTETAEEVDAEVVTEETAEDGVNSQDQSKEEPTFLPAESEEERQQSEPQDKK